jgi:hypothetical protein
MRNAGPVAGSPNAGGLATSSIENKEKLNRFGSFKGMMRSIRSCHRGEVNYTRQVRLNWSRLGLATLLTLVLAGAGCSGINASQSVSPASFFLPGLLKNDAPTNAPALTPGISVQIAAVK